MKVTRSRAAKSLPTASACNRREHSRMPVTFALMYSAQDATGDLLMGDGSVVDLSHNGLGIQGTCAVQSGMEMTLFLYLPDGQDPLFVMEARVAWVHGHRFGVEFIKVNLRERNRLRYFLSANLVKAA